MSKAFDVVMGLIILYIGIIAAVLFVAMVVATVNGDIPVVAAMVFGPLMIGGAVALISMGSTVMRWSR